MNDVGRTTVRVWIDKQLVVTEDVGAEGEWAHVVGRHIEMIGAADRDGKVWLIECELHDFPPDERFLRFGTDTGGIVDPIPIDLSQFDK